MDAAQQRQEPVKTEDGVRPAVQEQDGHRIGVGAALVECTDGAGVGLRQRPGKAADPVSRALSSRTSRASTSAATQGSPRRFRVPTRAPPAAALDGTTGDDFEIVDDCLRHQGGSGLVLIEWIRCHRLILPLGSEMRHDQAQNDTRQGGDSQPYLAVFSQRVWPPPCAQVGGLSRDPPAGRS